MDLQGLSITQKLVGKLLLFYIVNKNLFQLFQFSEPYIIRPPVANTSPWKLNIF